ncbi:alpha/beta fold hydrolase [Pendulispora albinea]|uniref:Alpha/beta hydrolase n=1 Tax=Pendulispora albinea TaxID=2741071 RepID=A0ABZ2M6J8_9BACT
MDETLVTSVDGHPLRAFSRPWDAQKPALTFVLPFGTKYDIAQPLFEQLGARFNVLTWEARMILDDPRADVDVARITPAMHVADMMSVLARFGVARSDVIGYCSGAGIALLAAQQYPSSFSRLLLVAGEYVLPRHTCARTRFQEDVDALLPLAAKSKAHASAVFSRIPQREGVASDPVRRAAALPFSRPEYLHRFGANYVQYRHVRFLEVARSIAHTALVLVGRRDEQVTVESSALIHEKLAHSRFHVDPAADHYDVCRGNTTIERRVLEFLSPPSHPPADDRHFDAASPLRTTAPTMGLK